MLVFQSGSTSFPIGVCPLTNLSKVFNQILVFCGNQSNSENQILSIPICPIPYCSVLHLYFRDLHLLQNIIRHNWSQHYGYESSANGVYSLIFRRLAEQRMSKLHSDLGTVPYYTILTVWLLDYTEK